MIRTRTFAAALLTLALAAVGPTPAHAQSFAGADPAERLRSGVPSAIPRGDAVIAAPSAAPARRAAVARLALPPAPPRRTAIAASAGLILGAAAGAATACHFNRDDYGIYCGGQNDTKVFLSAALGGAAGALLGGWLFGR